jgi:hypothetical protein
MTLARKLSTVDAINKEGAYTRASERQGIETGANKDGEKERARDMESGNRMVKERGAA